MAFRYLDDASLDAVRKAAVNLGFASDDNMQALVRGLPKPFVAATMPSGGTAAARLFDFVGELNTIRVLATGEVPLHVWLKAAIFLAAGRPEELVFRRALEVSSVDGLAQPRARRGPVGSGGVTPGIDIAPTLDPAPDVDALPRTGSGLEIQIGDEDDTLEVAFLHAGAAAARSVAKLMVHRHFEGVPSMLAGNKPDRGNGTGWMIGPRLLITNWHVINGRGPLERAASEQDFQLQGAATEVLFDFFASGAASASATSVGCVASDRTLDFALLRLPVDAPDRPPLPLRTTAILKPLERALRERVNVLQHPEGEPMRLGFRNNFVVTGTNERLSYLTDTKGGASGSPLCDDAWFVAGLHRGFQTIPGGPLMVFGQQIRQENHGTPIPRIMAHLKEHHPDLHAEIIAGQL